LWVNLTSAIWPYWNLWARLQSLAIFFTVMQYDATYQSVELFQCRIEFSNALLNLIRKLSELFLNQRILF
jgi:hypothetical protein